MDWQYKTQPQNGSFLGLNQQQGRWPRGKVLGGSSVLNSMAYVRGNPNDYNRWSDIRGCQGWSYKEVLPFFRRIETVDIPDLSDSELRGHDGPIAVTRALLTGVGDSILKIAEKLGFGILKDYNGETQEGFGLFQFNINRFGRRQSTAYSYLRPAMKRENLHVVKNALVTKISLDTSQKLATGVEFMHNGYMYSVMASKEVIISGGAVNSPQILMLSGIGPKKELEELGIDVIIDNPAVGSNLIDHHWSHISWTINSTADAVDPRGSTFLQSLEYFILGNGRLTTPGMELVGFLHSGAEPKTHTPDIQLFFFPYDPLDGNANVLNLEPEVAEAGENLGKGRPKISFSITLQQPLSVGQLKLQSRDPEAHPLIDPQPLSNPRDIDALVAGLKLTTKIIGHPELKKHNPISADEHIPGCEKFEMHSDAYLRCHVLHKTTTLYHPASTCRMGPKIENSVVDPRLRVHGIKNLRVIDTSVFPDHVTGNTNVPTMMIAEKGAQMIKDDNVNDE